MANDNTPKDGDQPKPSDDMNELNELLGKISESDKPREKAAAEPEKKDIIKKPTGSSDENENIDSWIEKITEKEDEDTPEEMGVVTRILSVFSQPTALFRYLRNKPDFMVPILIIIALSIITSFLTYDLQLDEGIAMYENMSSDLISEEDRDQAVDQMENNRYGFKRYLAIFGYTPIVSLVFLAIASLVFWFVGRTLLGGEANYVQTFSMFSYSWLFYAILGAIMILPFIVMQNSLDIDFSLARLMERDEGSSLYRFLTGIDPIKFWTVALIGIGTAVINRLSLNKGLIAVGILWLVYLLVYKVAMGGFMHRFGMSI